jgi:short-subunit dehydrogenase
LPLPAIREAGLLEAGKAGTKTERVSADAARRIWITPCSRIHRHHRRLFMSNRQLAIVTGASSGIGRELAAICAAHDFDLIVAADDPAIHDAAQALRGAGATVEALQADLATVEGVDRLYAMTTGRPVDALLANAGHGLGDAFLDQDFAAVRHVIDTNVTGTIYLIQKVGRDMRARGQGRILITGSVAGFMPGTFHAVYNGTKAFIDSFSFALRAELKDSGVTVTCLMPGATETEFFERAGMQDTKVAQDPKDDPADVAKVGFEAMMRGDGDVVSGWQNKLQTTIANVTPAGMLAEQHRKMAEPGSGTKGKK